MKNGLRALSGLLALLAMWLLAGCGGDGGKCVKDGDCETFKTFERLRDFNNCRDSSCAVQKEIAKPDPQGQAGVKCDC